MPAIEVGKICRLIMLKLLPALPENDIQSFGEALTEIQRIVGDTFAPAQGGRFSSSPTSECIKFLLQEGVYGAGQSSWGPTVYGVVKNEQAKVIRTRVQAFLNKSVGGEVFVAKANNRGAAIKVLR
jgi:beta-RFAP synthase